MPLTLMPGHATPENQRILDHANQYMNQHQLIGNIIEDRNLRLEMTSGSTQVVDYGYGPVIQ